MLKSESGPKITKTEGENYLSENWLDSQPPEIADESKILDIQEKTSAENKREKKWISEGKMN